MKIHQTLFLSLLLGCNNKNSSPNPTTTTKPQQVSPEQVFKSSYDIPELKNYKDSSKYLALFTITKKYNNTIIIELSETANGINLCVKQPVVESDYRSFDSSRSLPFNQLCYWYVDDEAKKIKNSFGLYQIDSVTEDIKCPSCLDPEIWTVEVYDHGIYSSTTKDYLSRRDSAFTDTLFDKVRLYERNGYRIKF